MTIDFPRHAGRFISGPSGEVIAVSIHGSVGRIEKLAVLCPGYLDSKDLPHLLVLADAFMDRGYTAVRFDPTGTCGSWAARRLV